MGGRNLIFGALATIGGIAAITVAAPLIATAAGFALVVAAVGTVAGGLGAAGGIVTMVVGGTQLATSGSRTAAQDEETNRAVEMTQNVASLGGMGGVLVATATGADERGATRLVEIGAGAEGVINVGQGVFTLGRGAYRAGRGAITLYRGWQEARAVEREINQLTNLAESSGHLGGVPRGSARGAAEELELAEQAATTGVGDLTALPNNTPPPVLAEETVDRVLGWVPDAQGECLRNALCMSLRFAGREADITDVSLRTGEGNLGEDLARVRDAMESAWGTEARFRPGALSDVVEFARQRGPGTQVLLNTRKVFRPTVQFPNGRTAGHSLLGRVNAQGHFEIWDAVLSQNPSGGYNVVRVIPDLSNSRSYTEFVGFRLVRF